MKINVGLIFKNNERDFFNNSWFGVFVSLKYFFVLGFLQKITPTFLFGRANLMKIIEFTFLHPFAIDYRKHELLQFQFQGSPFVLLIWQVRFGCSRCPKIGLRIILLAHVGSSLWMSLGHYLRVMWRPKSSTWENLARIHSQILVWVTEISKIKRIPTHPSVSIRRIKTKSIELE